MILTADLHLKEENAEDVFVVLEELRGVAQQDIDGTLAILGDFWHTRYRVPIRLQNRILEFLEQTISAGVSVILLPGNHDQIDVGGDHALAVFRNMRGVYVYSEPTQDKFGVWVPYRKHGTEDILKSMSPSECLFLHYGVRGAAQNDFHKDDSGLGLGMLSKWNHVFCGHYHKHQALGNVTYIGSPYQTRADEAGQEKGYGVWDSDRREFVWVPVTWGKKYHRWQVSVDSPIDISKVHPTDELRIEAAPGVDCQKLGEVLQQRGFSDVTITPMQAAQQARLSVSAHATLDEYAQAFLEIQKTELDKQRLLAVFREIVKCV